MDEKFSSQQRKQLKNSNHTAAIERCLHDIYLQQGVTYSAKDCLSSDVSYSPVETLTLDDFRRFATHDKTGRLERYARAISALMRLRRPGRVEPVRVKMPKYYAVLWAWLMALDCGAYVDSESDIDNRELWAGWEEHFPKLGGH